MEQKMPYRVLLEHNVRMPPEYIHEWCIKQLQSHGVPIGIEDNRGQYLNLGDFKVNIVTVRTNEQLQAMMNVMSLAERVGIDTESYALEFNHPLQLVQIAINKTAYLIRRKHLDALSDPSGNCLYSRHERTSFLCSSKRYRKIEPLFPVH